MKKSPYVDPERRGLSNVDFFTRGQKIRSKYYPLFILCWVSAIAGILFSVLMIADLYWDKTVTLEHVLSVDADYSTVNGLSQLTDYDFVKTKEGNVFRVHFIAGSDLENRKKIWIVRSGLFSRPLEILPWKTSKSGFKIERPYYSLVIIAQLIISSTILDFKRPIWYIYLIGLSSILISSYMIWYF